MLPTPSELDAPGLWLARIDLPDLDDWVERFGAQRLRLARPGDPATCGLALDAPCAPAIPAGISSSTPGRPPGSQPVASSGCTRTPDGTPARRAGVFSFREPFHRTVEPTETQEHSDDHRPDPAPPRRRGRARPAHARARRRALRGCGDVHASSPGRARSRRPSSSRRRARPRSRPAPRCCAATSTSTARRRTRSRVSGRTGSTMVAEQRTRFGLPVGGRGARRAPARRESRTSSTSSASAPATCRTSSCCARARRPASR